MNRLLLLALCSLCFVVHINGQIFPFSDLIVKTDTVTVRYSDLSPEYRQLVRIPLPYRAESVEYYLYFICADSSQVSELRIIPSPAVRLQQLVRLASGDFAAFLSADEITQSGIHKLFIEAITPQNETIVSQVELLPVASMQINLMQPLEEVFIGEEVIIPINVNNPANILTGNEWISERDYQYKISKEDNRVNLHFMSLSAQRYKPVITFNLLRPVFGAKNDLSFKYVLELLPVVTRTGKLAFLGIDAREIVMDNESRTKGKEIQIDNHRLLQIGRTYRIEAQEEPGGALVAELFMKTLLANNKVIAVLRPYKLHASASGYLYLKEGDQARFITNFSIVPQTTITSVQIMRDGREWSSQLRVFPGESAIIRIEGESLIRSRFSFDMPGGNRFDTILLTEKDAEFRINIPLLIPKSRLNLLVNDKPSGYSLTIGEFQRPRPLDFVTVDYGRGPVALQYINAPVFSASTIKDIRIAFDPDIIDEPDRMFGKQYLVVEIRIHGSRGELLESVRLDNVVVCPSETSPRYSFYSRNDCRFQEIFVNQHISRKSYAWEAWTRAVITISHHPDRHQGDVQRKSIELILETPVRFDVDVSFPAGLLIVKPGQQQLGNLSGISMAMVAQFSFYYKNQISRAKPYKIGAGFLALNAFNFSENVTNRDMGIVLIGSIFPTRRDVKMTFPLHVGTGYFLNQKQWFLLLGPGIRVSF